MSQQNPINKFTKMIQQEYRNGASEQEVANKLIECGLNPERALSAAKSARNSGNSFRRNVAAYLIAVTLIVGVTVLLLVAAMGVDYLVGNIQYLVFAFVVSSALFTLLSHFSGRLITYATFSVCLLWTLSASVYSVALFMHPGWEFVIDYRPRGFVLLLAGFLDFIGPKGLGVLISIIALCALFISWLFFHKIRAGSHESIDT